MLKKVAKILNSIFSVGVVLTLLLGGLSLVGYVVAMCIGGDTAAEICKFIFKQYLPWVIKATSVFVGFGLVGMYLGMKKALVMADEDILEMEKVNSGTENQGDAE